VCWMKLLENSSTQKTIKLSWQEKGSNVNHSAARFLDKSKKHIGTGRGDQEKEEGKWKRSGGRKIAS